MPKESDIIIGQNIKTYRKENKLTQKELAHLIGKSEITIRKYERGDITIPTVVLLLIAKILKTSLFKLIYLAYPYSKDLKSFMEYLPELEKEIGFELDPNGNPTVKLFSEDGGLLLGFGSFENYDEHVDYSIRSLHLELFIESLRDLGCAVTLHSQNNPDGTFKDKWKIVFENMDIMLSNEELFDFKNDVINFIKFKLYDLSQNKTDQE